MIEIILLAIGFAAGCGFAIFGWPKLRAQALALAASVKAALGLQKDI